VSEFNPYSRKLYADPYPAYAKLREEDPVYYNERFGFWVISRYEDVASALKNWSDFTSGGGITLANFSGLKPMIILMDPPRHDQLRAILLRAFTPRRVASLERQIRTTARELVHELSDRGRCEFVTDFAAPFPTTVIADLLGIDPADRDRFKHWSDEIMTSQSVDADSLRNAYAEIFEYFERVVGERRREPRDDLVSALIGAEVDGDRLSEDELLGFCALLLIAGNETMANFLSNAMLTLDRQRDVRRELLSDTSLMPTAVDELLRFEPSVHELGRTLGRDVELHGRTMKEGDRVLLMLASANRDPRQFTDPDRLDVRRHPNPHLSFGLGIHFCLGASLARLEAQVALEELLAGIPDYRVESDEIEWFRTPAVRGPASLPLALPKR
jgi:cytochrome P450